jgi:cell division protein FtsA
MATGKKNELIGALDVGSTKVCCFIARAEGEAQLRVVGIGHKASKGIRSGAVTDMEGAEESIRAAVEDAERMAGETIRGVVVNLACGQPASHTVGVEVAIAGQEVGDADLKRILDQAQVRDTPGEREAIHAIPTEYTLDGVGRIPNPRGLRGSRLGVGVHVVTAASGPLRNLRACVERADLEVAAQVVSPYAAGLATLVADEIDLGVTLVDMGGGVTTLSVFYGGSLVHSESIALGGTHVTNDIARGLSTPTAHAERIKTLYGSAIASPSDATEVIDVPQVGESDLESAHHIPRSMLVGIIQPRIEEILEMVRERLERSGFAERAGRRVVLTGGACQLQGVRELASRLLDKQVRIGRPIRLTGLAEAAAGPAFATCAGLLAYAARAPFEAVRAMGPDALGGRGPFGKFGQWLKRNF